MAKNTIRGLTVEIGGDTTKLGKALADVDKKSRDLQGELRQIDKLLKLDPGNTDLLAQRQEVLAEAVETTAQKLKTLKEAEKQVQKQFKKGEVSEEQVRALQREIIETEKKMDSYKQEIKQTGKALDKMDDSTKQVEKSSDGLGSKLGSLAKGGVKLLAAGVAATAGALIASAEASREYRTEMGKLDTAFTTAGHSSEAAKNTYKALQGVLGETDQAVEAANHLAKLTDNEQDLQKWTDICTGVYATFGASLPIEGLTEAANETAKVGQVTGPLADALNWAGVSEDEFNASLAACSSEQERQTLIMETLNGLYDDAASKYKETNAEVIRANEANEEWMAAMAEVGGVIEPLLTDVKLLGASLLSDLVPGIKEVAGAFRAMLSGDEEAAANLGEALSGIFSQLLTKVTDLLPQAAQIGVSLVTTLSTSIVMALPQLLDTLVQVVLALVNGVTQAIPQIVAAFTSMVPQFVQALVNGIPLIVQGAINLLLAIAQAIPQIIPPLIEAIPPIVQAIADALVMAVPQLIDGALTFLMAIVDAIPRLIPVLVEAIPQILDTLVDGLLKAIPQLIQAAVKLLNAIIQAIPKIIPPLVKAIPQIITTLVNGLVQAVPQLVQGAITLLNAIIQAIPIIIQALIPQIPTIVNSIINGLIQMSPALINGAVQLLMAIVKAIPQVVSALIKNLPQILKAITSVLSGGVKLVFNIGKDLVKGLWNGIKDMTSWVIGKIKGFGDSVLKGIKSFFGIKSPSRVFKNEVGKMLALGLADGIEDNADAPLDAMAGLSRDLLGEAEEMNGLTLERRVAHTFAAPAAPSSTESGMFGRLDKILAAIERGQVLTIDGSALVGATAGYMDNALGRRHALAARGAM